MNKKWIGLGVAGGSAIMLALPMLTRRAMQITTILKKDHRLVSGFFMTLETARGANSKLRKAIFHQIKSALEVHSKAEEEVFYTAVARIGFGDAHSRTEHSRQEHQQIRDLLDTIDSLGPDSSEFMDRVKELKEVVQHHVAEEEKEVFSLARNHMYPEELTELGRRFSTRKKELSRQGRAA